MDISLYLKLEPMFGVGMSRFQMENFVVGDSITPYRKLRQALIETRARLETITTHRFDLEEQLLKKQKAEQDLEKATDPIEKGLADVQVRRHEFEINRKQSIIEQLESEAKFFLAQIDQIVQVEFQGAEAAVQLLKESTTHDVKEAEFWTKKLARGAFADLINYGTISKGIMESLMCLPVEQRVQIINEAAEQHVVHTQLISQQRDLQLVSKD